LLADNATSAAASEEDHPLWRPGSDR